MSTDELFASLGGSLMKDLWADLEVDGDDGMGSDLLEQLERELSHLDETPGNQQGISVNTPILETAFAPPGGSQTMSTANYIVSHQNFEDRSADLPVSSQIAPPTTADAWQKSLQNFTSVSGLEHDFLAADSARKKPQPPPGFLDRAEEYTLATAPIVATPVIATPIPPGMTATLPGPPPGMGSPPPGLNPTTKTLSNTALPPPGMLPVAISHDAILKPLNSTAPPPPGISPPPGMKPSEPKSLLPSIAASIPSSSTNSSLLPPLQSSGSDTVSLKERLDDKKEEAEQEIKQSSESAESTSETVPGNSLKQDSPEKSSNIPHVVSKKTKEEALAIDKLEKLTISSPPSKVHATPETKHAQTDPAKERNAAPPPSRTESSNQQKPINNNHGRHMQQMQAKPLRVYCQVHPAAPPIPASALESKYMPSRDLAYILHSMLKPVLLRGTSSWDYDIQLLQRHAPQPQQKPREKNRKEEKEEQTQDEMVSRAKKTMEWMKKESILGHISKTDVTRPRALLATPKLSSVSSNEDQAQRALLWKGRLYIDQGQVAATSLIELWRTTPPGKVPPEVQPHLLKLFKVLGIKVHKNSTYSMDSSKNNLTCILKLSKGRLFVSRLLEKALLPPKVVEVLIPAILHHACKTFPGGDNSADRRLFGSIMHVMMNLSSKQPEMLLACLKAVSIKEALASQPRMECVHAILRLGQMQQITGWAELEAEFMKLLS